MTKQFGRTRLANARIRRGRCVALLLRTVATMMDSMMDSKDSTAELKSALVRDDEVRDANSMIASGIGIGALGAVAAAISGAVCPLCIVAVPALVGAGAYKRWRASRRRRVERSALP